MEVGLEHKVGRKIRIGTLMAVATSGKKSGGDPENYFLMPDHRNHL